MRLLARAFAALGVTVPAVLVGPFNAGLPALLIAVPAAPAFAGLAGRGREPRVVRGRQAQHQAANHEGDNLAERHGAVGAEKGGGGNAMANGDGEYTAAVGAKLALSVTLHGRDTAPQIATRQGVGLAKARTGKAFMCGVRSLEGRVLALVLTSTPIARAGSMSRRTLAARLGVCDRIVRWWCAGERPIDSERLYNAAPLVWVRWFCTVARLFVERPVVAASERGGE